MSHLNETRWQRNAVPVEFHHCKIGVLQFFSVNYQLLGHGDPSGCKGKLYSTLTLIRQLPYYMCEERLLLSQYVVGL